MNTFGTLATRLGLSAAAAAIAGAGAEIDFADVTASSGITFVHHDAPPVPGLFDGQNTRFGVGAAVSDYDRDGDQDVYIPDSWGFPSRLYRNDGSGSFTDVTVESGAGDLGYGHMALFVDLDNDGFDDLVVINDYNIFAEGLPPSQIYRNDGDGTFTNVTDESGFLPIDSTFGGATAGDYDHDGDLDLFVVGWYDWNTYLYRNDGDFRFTDVTDAAGARPPKFSAQWSPVFADVDSDGWVDLFCAVDFAPDYLFHNNGDGTFTDVSAARSADHVGHDMGVAVADLDQDLDLDLYTTNITGGDNCEVAHGCNWLYLNDGSGHFTDGTAESGLGDTAWGWGVWIFDADLDGARDVLAVNGWTQPEWHTPASFFHNDGTNRFTERAAECGIAHVGNTRGLTPIDFDNDGDVDFLMFDVLNPATVYENRTTRGDHHWLVVAAEGGVSNRNGAGARVYITAAGHTQMHEIIVGGSFYAAPPLEAHFGLGSADSVESLVVTFPSGRRVRMCDVRVDQRLTVLEPAAPACPGDVDTSGTVDGADLLSVLAAWGRCSGCCEADQDLDFNVGFHDLITVLDRWGACP